VSYVSTVTADGAVDFYRLGDLSGTTATDSIGANPGTYNGGFTLNQAGAINDGNPAVGLDGASGTVTNPVGIETILGQGAHSVELWLYAASIAATMGALTGSQINTRVVVTNTGQVTWRLRASDGTFKTLTTGAGTIAANTWYHVLMTWDGSVTVPTMVLYLNGVQAATGGFAPGPITWGTGTWTLGFGAGTFFNGRLDEVALYPSVLSSAQALAHYNAGAITGGGGAATARYASRYRLGAAA